MNDFRKGPLWIITGTLVAATLAYFYYAREEHLARMKSADLSYKMQRQMYEQMTVSRMEDGFRGP